MFNISTSLQPTILCISIDYSSSHCCQCLCKTWLLGEWICLCWTGRTNPELLLLFLSRNTRGSSRSCSRRCCKSQPERKIKMIWCGTEYLLQRISSKLEPFRNWPLSFSSGSPGRESGRSTWTACGQSRSALALERRLTPLWFPSDSPFPVVFSSDLHFC